MTSEIVKKRLASLRKQLEQAVANVNALGGAIQDCEFFLSEIEKEETYQTADPIKAVK